MPSCIGTLVAIIARDNDDTNNRAMKFSNNFGALQLLPVDFSQMEGPISGGDNISIGPKKYKSLGSCLVIPPPKGKKPKEIIKFLICWALEQFFLSFCFFFWICCQLHT